MAPNAGRVLLAILVVGLAPACTTEDPQTVRPSELTPGERAGAISLESAMKDGLVEATIPSEGSTLHAMTILLEPNVTSEPWIRIGAGLWTEGSVGDGGFATYQTLYVRIPRDTPYRVSLPHVRIRSGKSDGIWDGATISELNHDVIRPFFEVLDLKQEPLDWKLVQVATWALSEDIGYARLRRSGLRGNPLYVGAEDLVSVTRLLAEAGHTGSEFAFWSEALDVLGEQVEQYDRLVFDEEPGALGPFKQVCDFYPFEIASDIVIGAFDRHAGPEGRDYRRYAIEVLGRHGGAHELEILEQRSRFEDDEILFDHMMAIIAEVSARPIK